MGHSANSVVRHNVKTRTLIPAAILAQLDQKIDDGLGRLWAAAILELRRSRGCPAAARCMQSDAPTAPWGIDGAENCGAATLLY